MPPFLDIMQTVFPVVATVPGQGAELARADFFGTAFAIAPGVFLTAAHVVTAAEEHGVLTLAGPSADKPMLGSAVVAYREVWPAHDTALLFCYPGPVTVLDAWLRTRAQVLTDLSAFGYPHAVTRQDETEHFEVVFRAYKGHVITTRGFERLPGRPAIYEMSSPFPEGLSGAPLLLLAHNGEMAVAGLVLGSASVEYGGVEHRVGIAMIGEEIMQLHSDRLDGRIGDKLNIRGAELRHDEAPETAP